MVGKIGNSREMSCGPFPAPKRLSTAKWFDDQSLILLFCNNTFSVTPIDALCHYKQRDLKWSLNFLGPKRERIYGIPVLSKSAPLSDDGKLRRFLILEIEESYIRRKEDEDLKLIQSPSND